MAKNLTIKELLQQAFEAGENYGLRNDKYRTFDEWLETAPISKEFYDSRFGLSGPAFTSISIKPESVKPIDPMLIAPFEKERVHHFPLAGGGEIQIVLVDGLPENKFYQRATIEEIVKAAPRDPFPIVECQNKDSFNDFNLPLGIEGFTPDGVILNDKETGKPFKITSKPSTAAWRRWFSKIGINWFMNSWHYEIEPVDEQKAEKQYI